jgi:hypothetical protein
MSEDGEWVALLEKAAYGTYVAPRAWLEELSSIFRTKVFEMSLHSYVRCCRRGFEVLMVTRVVVVLRCAPAKSLEWVPEALRHKYEV